MADGEADEQIAVLQEMAGAIMTGIAARYHKAYLFYEPFGRAGKGVMQSILQALVPDQFVRAISPMVWDSEYYMAPLAGARFNVVGELPDNKQLPANAFKMVTGGDLLTGRHPAGRPIFFRNEAAHLFTSNCLPAMTEQSEALFARWVVVNFPNSRLKSGLPLDPGLADRIIGAEIAGIAWWALEGARRLLRNEGRYSSSRVQTAIVARWRTRNSSVEEFIHEACERGPKLYMKRAHFFGHYVTWCEKSGRKPFGKQKVFELVDNNLSLKIACRKVQGHFIYRGVAWVKKDEPDVEFGSDLELVEGEDWTDAWDGAGADGTTASTLGGNSPSSAAPDF